MWNLPTCWTYPQHSGCPSIALWPNLHLDWQHHLRGNPWWLKTYAANSVSQVVEILPSDRSQNHLYCAYRGLHPSELLNHTLGRIWLAEVGRMSVALPVTCSCSSCATRKQSWLYTFQHKVNHLSYFSHNTQSSLTWPMLPPGFSSSSTTVKLKKCQIPKQLSFLTIQEIHNAKTYWTSVIQCQHFSQEINTLLKHRIPHVPIFFRTNFWTLRSVACRQQDFQLNWWVL